MTRRRLYIISDLHLGGAAPSGDHPGFQICTPEMRGHLAAFIRAITPPAPDGADIELVIDGDFVDFLAESSPGEKGEPVFSALRTDPVAALAALRALIAHIDGSVGPEARVFDALKGFVRAGRRLTVLLGNHDIELALPPVRRALTELLTGGAPARVEFLLNGEAYTAGPALIEHGNRYDGWNAVHYDGLRALCSKISRGEPGRPFPVQPGSRLVVEVMNPLKQRYRFIDLLKPETQAAIPLLAALEPDVLVKLRPIVSAAEEALRATSVDVLWKTRDVVPGNVSALEGLDFGVPGAAPTAPAAETVRATSDLDETRALLEEAEGAWAPPPSEDGDGGVSFGALESLDSAKATLGDWLDSARSLWRSLAGEGIDTLRLRAVRAAFLRQREAIHGTFDVAVEHARYLDAARMLAGDDVRVVVFGHTHLPKSISLGERAHYLNTGTWVPTMALDARWYDPATPEDEALAELKRFLADLKENRVEGWLRRKGHCAMVEFETTDDGGWKGEARVALCAWDDGGLTTVSERVLHA